MNDNFAIQLFEGKKVRIVWDAEKEKYYFAVTDIVQVLTDTVDPRDYIKKMLRRDPELKSSWGDNLSPNSNDGSRWQGIQDPSRRPRRRLPHHPEHPIEEGGAGKTFLNQVD